MFRKVGPGILIAAAFIGPGTVTACTMAGVTFGFSLLWAMLVSILATYVLQEMSARLGIVSQKGLADVIKEELGSTWLKFVAMGLMLSAILLGNAAYEAGNIGGATLGMQAMFGTQYQHSYPIIIGVLAFLLLYFGTYRVLEKVFVVLVLIMSLSFVLTAILTGPNLLGLLEGLLVPSVPVNSALTIIALVGTTVVPYNLFLHASLVSQKWKVQHLGIAKKDTFISIAIGGMVSICIIISAAAVPSVQVKNVLDLAKALEPLYGSWAVYFLGVGLFAAGITSAITAPLAAAYVANSCFGWNAGLKDIKFRAIWILILGLGVFCLSFNIKPIEIIKFAQVANGLILPVIALFLVWVVNSERVMGIYKNNYRQNLYGLLIIFLSFILGVKSIVTVLGISV